MAVYFFEASDGDRLYLQDGLAHENIRFFAEPLTTVDQLAKCRDADVLSVFVHSRVGADVIEALPKLKLIATRSTGYDHINLPAAGSRGILVSNVPTYGDNTVAEHTFALMLALTRNLHRAYTRTSSGDFSLEGLQGIDLKGKTLGVVGTGHIGLHVIRIARAFGMRVVAFDPRQNAMAADLLGYEYRPLKELLNESDIVTLHAPLNGATQHLIGEHNIGEFKPGAILINTARGGLVETTALLKALDEGRLRGAGLDVVEGEEVFNEEKQLLLQPGVSSERLRMALQNLTLLHRPDVILTPHLAYDSREAVNRILDTTIANIKAMRAGAPENVVHI